MSTSPTAIGWSSLDAVDRRLLELLAVDSRRPTAELARDLGLARSTVQSRLDRLRDIGVIRAFTIRLSERLEADTIKAHIMLAVGPKQSADVVQALKRLPEVKALHAISGIFDLIAVVHAPSVVEMDALVDRIGLLPGVERTQTAIVLSTRFER
ncbi:Lrp/AsnC family transcriptional regulator [Insolitispirillum peregrinum]|uniref:Transcriptional regulator, AsnC family n=1 Tax=Insolitispirillum peregrinum TaxID=80876 RepID=A0A1N7IIW9_9PROT|nr:Lrp/AsnC family transcriptional regulator [Insolitispirillum peregrinum]SIS36931.1 transcriptional regulator, AsnC family [Insolitispirillum peregrinum]